MLKFNFLLLMFDGVHRLVAWKPDPTLKRDSRGNVVQDASDQHEFVDFFDLYGKVETTDQDRPSARLSEEKEEDKKNANCLQAKRGFELVRCTVCSKQRVIFSKQKQLSQEQRSELNKVTEQIIYSCGSPIVPTSHPLSSHVAIRLALKCSDPVENHYYANSKWPPCCSHCSETDDLIVNTELLALFKAVRPICASCKAKGIPETTIGKLEGACSGCS